MKVPLLDLRPQLDSIRGEVHAAVGEVVDSTQYVLGPKVEALEAEIAAYSGAAHGVGVSSGTDALLVSLMALGVGAGDLVLTTPYSFFATAGAIARLGATPIFVDIEPESYNIDPGALRAWFDDAGDARDRVKAIMPVHLYGQCADMKPILAVAEEFGLAVIEDAAQAIGAGYPSKGGVSKAGGMGLMGCFSFFPTKNLGGIGDGGMVVTSDAALAEKLKQLRNHGMEPKYYHPMVGGNFRLDPLQAAVLSVKLKYLDDWHAKRRENAAHYDERLAGTPLNTPKAVWGREHHIYNQYVVSVPERREELRSYLADREIGHEVYYPVPLHSQECFRELGYRAAEFPRSEHAAKHTIALPIYPELSEAQLDHVVDALREFYGAN